MCLTWNGQKFSSPFFSLFPFFNPKGSTCLLMKRKVEVKEKEREKRAEVRFTSSTNWRSKEKEDDEKVRKRTDTWQIRVSHNFVCSVIQLPFLVLSVSASACFLSLSLSFPLGFLSSLFFSIPSLLITETRQNIFQPLSKWERGKRINGSRFSPVQLKCFSPPQSFSPLQAAVKRVLFFLPFFSSFLFILVAAVTTASLFTSVCSLTSDEFASFSPFSFIFYFLSRNFSKLSG